MKQLTLAEIKTLDNKMPIPSFSGTINEIYEQKTGVGEYGPWFLQNLLVSDDTGELTVTWGGEDAFDQGCKGKTYQFESSETKHGLKGLTWERRTKAGKTYESVKVTPSSKIKILEGGATSSPKSVDAKTEDSPPLPDPDWPEAPPIAPEAPVSRPSALDERQRAIIRQHSQSMSLEVLKLKVALNQLTVEDLTPSKLRSLADYFDQDVFGAAS